MGQVIQCKNNLRQLGVGLVAHGASNDGAFCTGAWDNRSDRSLGPIDEKGWVADLVLGDYAKVGEMLCPAHPAQYSQNLALGRVNQKAWKPFTEEELVELIAEGFNTNYCNSWYLAHTEAKDDYGLSGLKDPKWTKGPLEERFTTRVAASYIPLLATARLDFSEDPITYTNQGEAQSIKQMSDGPLAQAGIYVKQDYTDFGPAHGRSQAMSSGRSESGRVIANFVFADGHVDSINDTDGDGIFDHKAAVENGYSTYRYTDVGMNEKVFGGSLIKGKWY
jgi:prepilin-type processing-associated H-X9-DG protein